MCSLISVILWFCINILEDEEQEIADEVPEETYEAEFNVKSYLLK